MLFGVDMPQVLYVRCVQSLIYEADNLARIVREKGIDYAVYDSIAFACSGAPESAETANSYFQAVRKIGAGSLHVAHVTKSDGGDQKPFGSVFWHNGARATYFVKANVVSRDGKLIHVRLINRKANLSGLCPDIRFKIEFTDERTIITPDTSLDSLEVSGSVKGNKNVRDGMILSLRENNVPMSYDELAEKLGFTQGAIRQAVSRNKDVFTKDANRQVILR